MRVALLTPPLVQLNTPYPATAYLTRWLRGQGHVVEQRDLGIELMLQVLSRAGLEAVFDTAADRDELPEPAWAALAQRARHEAVIEDVVAFLQGNNPTFGYRLHRWEQVLPATPRLAALAEAELAADDTDTARLVASRYVADLADLVAATVDEGFGMARYQHHLAMGPVSFDPIAARLDETTLLDRWLDALTDEVLDGRPDLVGISLPFPGTLVAGLRMGRRLKAAGVSVLMGGGYVSTELREAAEPRLWDCTDGLVYDDGEGPIQAWLEQLAGGPDRRHRTRTPEGLLDHPFPRPDSLPVADYTGLDLNGYLQILDTLNPAHRLWSDGRWNKATLAHGCYWKRCAFCDVNLDYVARFVPTQVARMVDAMEQVAAQTGQTGFHLVDEAAPPRLLRALALELLARDLHFTWWGNIRFETAFTPDLCRLLSRAGLVMVTGGLEVASDRLLELMDKGVTVAQATRACAALSGAGIRVHAYLMYGFPTQTLQETIDSAEVVRQLFAAGLLTSAFWHRFVLTRHSRVFAEPERYAISFERPEGVFATNDLPHRDPSGADHDALDGPLVESLAAWMAGEDLDAPVAAWFGPGAPEPTVRPGAILRHLDTPPPDPGPKSRLVWLGSDWLETADGGVVLFTEEGAPVEVPARLVRKGAGLLDRLPDARPGGPGLTLEAARETAGARVWRQWWSLLQHAGLLAVG